MGLFSSDTQKPSRAERRAQKKAMRKRAKFEAKYDAKERRAERKRGERAVKRDQRRSEKRADRAQKRALRSETRKSKHESKAAIADAKARTAEIEAAAKKKKLTPKNARRALSIGRVVAPVAGPLVYRGAVVLREKLGDLQAARVGVAPETLRQFSGKGAPLAARIATTQGSLHSLTLTDTSPDAATFATKMDERLANLSVAVDAAESMSPGARKNAHRAIGNELSAIDADILARLGVTAS
ncbi:hypothetical protein GOARA_048_00970 [Gordonia araii NBRC 100433]|uniref:Uncharacterized protein n=1 Tax=Gordonia araii NBRC 100433 TaxID=1073574 RepID=G7H220_9ACTN|nr:DUF6474 family protein [Gordonia araii]NNG97228.1 hypothetical protein [Gordonia araii NBRC 100433]GAB09895.1 hypothetical protein GOARA_048_00970 [Gordonia araii NBRC 100433]